jgi:hypothetical protein
MPVVVVARKRACTHTLSSIRLCGDETGEAPSRGMDDWKTAEQPPTLPREPQIFKNGLEHPR